MLSYNDGWYDYTKAAEKMLDQDDPASAQVYALLALALAVIKVQDRLQELADAK